MSASIQDPFLLSSYGLAKHGSRSGNLYAAVVEPCGTSEYVVVTAQGDGVHVLDALAVHTMVSKTFGPSIIFASPAVARSEGDTCRVYAAIESVSGIPHEEGGRWLWSWSSSLSSGVVEDEVRKSLIPHPVNRIYAPAALPNAVILTSPDASVHMLDQDLQAVSSASSASSSAASEQLVKSFLFPRQASSYVSNLASTSSMYLAIVLSKGSDLFLRVHGVSEEACPALGEIRISGVDSHILDATLSPAGFLTVLDSAGTWRSWQVRLSNIGLTLSDVASVLRIQGMKIGRHEVSILGASASFVLLAGITSDAKVTVHIWDMQYSVLLASHSVPLPGSLSHTKKTVGVHVELAGVTPSQAVLILSPALSGKAKPSTAADSRSSVLMVPLTLPTSSTIAGALGKATASAKWIRSEAKLPSLPKGQDVDGKEVLLNTLRNAMDRGDADAAASIFSKWTATHAGTTLDHAFTKQILNIVLQPTKETATPYPGQVVKHLLNKRAVSASMVELGLISVLHLRQDWSGIELTLKTVIDVPEADIVALLKLAVDASRQHATDAMDVDATPAGSSPTAVPPLSTLLAACTNYTTSPSALRLAFRQNLGRAEDILVVMDVFDGWMAQWQEQAVPLGPPVGELQKNEQGVYLVPAPLTDPVGPPSLDKIVGFLQCLLDASLIALLQHVPAHSMLKRLSNRLMPALEDAETLAQLRAPLAPFAHAQARALRDGVPAGKPTAAPKQGDWRQRRKAKHEQAALAIGLYQLEELVI